MSDRERRELYLGLGGAGGQQLPDTPLHILGKRSFGRDTTESDLKSDVLAVLDTSAWSQLGPMADVVRNTSARRVVIDHHVSQDDMSAEAFKNTSSESSGRLILEAIDAIGATVSERSTD